MIKRLREAKEILDNALFEAVEARCLSKSEADEAQFRLDDLWEELDKLEDSDLSLGELRAIKRGTGKIIIH